MDASAAADGDADDDGSTSAVWAVSAEQRRYYEQQFDKLDKDPAGLLPGLEARRFFEKSGLPIPDLSAIW